MKRAVFALGLGLVAATIASLLATTPLARAFENQTYDARLAWSAPLSDQKSSIAMVEINDSSLQALEGTFGRWPWPRVVHSGVIDFLARGGARVIVYDVLFLERDTRGDFAVGSGRMTGAESDAALVESVRRAGNVILAASASSEGLINPASRPDTSAPALPGVVYRPGPGFQERLVLELPFDDLKNAAAGVGHTVLIKDTDGSARRQLPFIEYHQTDVPSLGVAAALAAERVPAEMVRLERSNVLRVGVHTLPLLEEPAPADRLGDPPTPSKQLLLSFRRAAQMPDGKVSIFPMYSFFDVLLSEDQLSSGKAPPIDPSVFRDKIVFVGTSAAGLQDIFSSPFGGAGVPGVQIHADGRRQRAVESFMRRASRGSELALTIGRRARRRLRRDVPAGRVGDGGRRSDRDRARVLADARGRRRRVGGGRDAAGRARLRALWRRRVAVLRRGPREAPRQAAVRPLRLEGRHRSADGESGAGAAGRRAARDDRAVLGHSRFHDGVRAAARPRPSSRS